MARNRNGVEVGPPSMIVIKRETPRLWRFEVLAESGAVIDYSLASTRGMVWRMARLSFRRASRESRPAAKEEP